MEKIDTNDGAGDSVSTTPATSSFEPPAIRVFARFEQITLGSGGSKTDGALNNKH